MEVIMNEFLTDNWIEALLYIVVICLCLYLAWALFWHTVRLVRNRKEETRKREELLKQADENIERYRELRKTIYVLCNGYDDRHGLVSEDKESAFNWFYKKYDLLDLKELGGRCSVEELYTEEELQKIKN